MAPVRPINHDESPSQIVLFYHILSNVCLLILCEFMNVYRTGICVHFHFWLGARGGGATNKYYGICVVEVIVFTKITGTVDIFSSLSLCVVNVHSLCSCCSTGRIAAF